MEDWGPDGVPYLGQAEAHKKGDRKYILFLEFVSWFDFCFFWIYTRHKEKQEKVKRSSIKSLFYGSQIES